MFTDGLVERRREHLDVGLARLGDLAASHANLPAQDFVETLAASVTHRFDDLAFDHVASLPEPPSGLLRALRCQ